MTSDDKDEKSSVVAFFLIVSALGDNPLGTKNICTTAKDACDKLQAIYAGKTLIYKLGGLNSFLNLKLRRKEQMVDPIAKMETTFSRLGAIYRRVSEVMQIAILLSALSFLPE